jgi:hypothetical protein
MWFSQNFVIAMYPNSVKKNLTHKQPLKFEHDAVCFVQALTEHEALSLKNNLQIFPLGRAELDVTLKALDERLRDEYESFPAINTFEGNLDFLPLKLPKNRVMACGEGEQYDIVSAYLEHDIHSAWRCLLRFDRALKSDEDQLIIDVLMQLLGVKQVGATPMTVGANAAGLSMFQMPAQEDTAVVGEKRKAGLR